MNTEFRNLTKEELKPLVGQLLEFDAGWGLRKGVLSFEGGEYWLPFMGLLKLRLYW